MKQTTALLIITLMNMIGLHAFAAKTYHCQGILEQSDVQLTLTSSKAGFSAIVQRGKKEIERTPLESSNSGIFDKKFELLKPNQNFDFIFAMDDFNTSLTVYKDTLNENQNPTKTMVIDTYLDCDQKEEMQSWIPKTKEFPK